jgi:hypothetical protein
VKSASKKYILGHNSKDKSTAKTDKSHLWKKGKSGNPKGRPNGSRNKVTISALNMIEGESEVLSRKAIEAALNGNIQMLKFCLERIIPVCKDTPVKIKIPVPKNSDDVAKMTKVILKKLSEGELTPSQAELIGRSADRHIKSLQLKNLEERLKMLEDRIIENARLRFSK